MAINRGWYMNYSTANAILESVKNKKRLVTYGCQGFQDTLLRGEKKRQNAVCNVSFSAYVICYIFKSQTCILCAQGTSGNW